MESFRSSYHHNKSMKGDPVGRIVVTGPRILYRNREYNSASVALHDYISEFKGTPTKLKPSVSFRNSNDVLELLTTPSGHNIYEQNDISKTSQISDSLRRGLKLSDFDSSRNENSIQNSKLIEDSYRRMRQVDGAIQVADALNKSHDVLKKVDEDRLSDIAPSVGDLQSLATESLISVNPFNPVSIAAPSVRPLGHIYSYRTPRSHTVSDLSLNRLNKDELNTGAHTSTHKQYPLINHKQLSSSLPKPNSLPERYGRPLHQPNQTTGQRHRYRSRSASPGFETNNRSQYHRELFRPPNWLEDQNASQSRKQTESDMRELKSKLGRRQPPSWIEDIVGSSDSSIVLSDHLGLFLHQEDISSVSGHSDPTSLSTTVPSLKLADLELLRDSSARTKNYQQKRNYRGHVQTSTPMKKSVPSQFNSDKRGVSVGLSDHLTLNTENYDHGRDGLNSVTARKSGDNSDAIYKSSDSKIGQMLRELDVIRQKLKSSSDDTHHCLSDLTPKPGATNLGNKFNVNGLLETLSSDQFHASIDLEKPLSSVSDVNLAALSSITKDLDQATRTLSLTDNGHHSICQSTGTDDVLEGDRDWGKTPALKSQFETAWDDRVSEKNMEGVIRDFMTDCLLDDQQQAKTPFSETLTGGAQPGSMEALKNMLFKLQWEASSNNLPSDLPVDRPTMPCMPPTQSHSIEVAAVSSQSFNGKPLKDYNFQSEPGGQSLERALVHLSRLQSLVQSDTFNPESKGNLTVQASSCLGN